MLGVVAVVAGLADLSVPGRLPTSRRQVDEDWLGRYRGFVMLDYEGIEDPATAVPRAATYMRGLLHLLQRRQLLTQPTGAPRTEGDAAALDAHPNSSAFRAPAENVAREVTVSG